MSGMCLYVVPFDVAAPLHGWPLWPLGAVLVRAARLTQQLGRTPHPAKSQLEPQGLQICPSWPH